LFWAGLGWVGEAFSGGLTSVTSWDCTDSGWTGLLPFTVVLALDLHPRVRCDRQAFAPCIGDGCNCRSSLGNFHWTARPSPNSRVPNAARSTGRFNLVLRVNLVLTLMTHCVMINSRFPVRNAGTSVLYPQGITNTRLVHTCAHGRYVIEGSYSPAFAPEPPMGATDHGARLAVRKSRIVPGVQHYHEWGAIQERDYT
jgi:hypothetical protein